MLADHGLRGCGFDLNPAMVVVAKARLISGNILPSLEPLALELIEGVDECGPTSNKEALDTWFKPRTARFLRCLEQSISRALVPQGNSDFSNPSHISELSTLACFYYVALFRTIRVALKHFRSTNPTWIRVPSKNDRCSISRRLMANLFLDEIVTMSDSIKDRLLPETDGSDIKIMVGDARCLPLNDYAVDAIITSPPYCTRIDYAVSTRPELAVLGVGMYTGFTELRRQLMGGVTIRPDTPSPVKTWGKTCLKTLDLIKCHRSKASATYYTKQFLQYFSDLELSLKELRRVCGAGRNCVMVVQDSMYKDIHVDLPSITSEMGINLGFELVNSFPYKVSSSFRTVNPRVRRHMSKWMPTEAALFFKSI